MTEENRSEYPLDVPDENRFSLVIVADGFVTVPDDNHEEGQNG